MNFWIAVSYVLAIGGVVLSLMLVWRHRIHREKKSLPSQTFYIDPNEDTVNIILPDNSLTPKIYEINVTITNKTPRTVRVTTSGLPYNDFVISELKKQVSRAKAEGYNRAIYILKNVKERSKNSVLTPAIADLAAQFLESQ